MKDRPAVDAVVPRPSRFASALTAPVRLLMAHFWKIFAAASLIAGLGVWYGVFSGSNGAHASSLTDAPDDDDPPSRTHAQQFRLMRDLIDKQSQPATIVFKNQAPAAVGYLASVDNDCVVLRSRYMEEAKEQTILIPWQNVLYIRLNTKIPAAELEVAASRDSRSKPITRTRR